MADIFQEVDEELRADRARRMLLRYGGWLAAAALLVVIATGAWQYRHWRQQKSTEKLAAVYFDGIRALSAQPPDHKKALAAFADVAARASGGYRALAEFQEAALTADDGNLAGAVAIWDRLAGDARLDPLLTQLAALLAVQRQIDSADPAQLAARLQPLLAADDPYRPLAEELSALLALRQGKTDQAKATLRALSQEPTAPPGLRQRASAFLVELGG